MKITYRTIVDEDVEYSAKDFANEISVYLADPDGWISRGYTFEASPRGKIQIHLSSPDTLVAKGCPSRTLSCAEMRGTHMRLNAGLWNGTLKNKSGLLQLKDYRQYMVTHEMGHILGFDHVECTGPKDPAPLMMQQTLGISVCVPNTKLTPKDG